MTNTSHIHNGVCGGGRVDVDGATVGIHLRLIDEHLATHLGHAPDRVDAVKDLLQEGLVAFHARTETAATLGLSELRRDIHGGLDDLTSATSTASETLRRLVADEGERLRAEASKLVAGVRVAAAEAQQAISTAMTEAIADPDLVSQLQDAMSGESSPLHSLEQRLEELSKTHQAALTGAISELSRAGQTLAAQYGRREGEERTTKVGEPFEVVIEDLLARACSASGDVVTDVRRVDGRNGARKGDFVTDVTRGDRTVARVAVEVKNISRGVSQAAVRQLVTETLTTRDAQAVLYVVSSPEVMPAGIRGQSVGVISQHAVAVAVNPSDEEAHAILAAAYHAARCLAAAEARRKELTESRLDTEALDHQVQRLRERIDGLGTIEKDLRVAAKAVSSQATAVNSIRSQLISDVDDLGHVVATAAHSQRPTPVPAHSGQESGTATQIGPEDRPGHEHEQPHPKEDVDGESHR